MRSLLCINTTNGRCSKNMLSIYRTYKEWVPPSPMCGLKGNILNLSSSCQHILILPCCWLLVAVVLLPYMWLLMHCDLTLLEHLRSLQSVPGLETSKGYSMLHVSHRGFKDNLIFFSLGLGHCKQLNTQRNSADTCKYFCKLEGWIFWHSGNLRLFKGDDQLYVILQFCIPESNGAVPKTGTDFVQFT